METVKVEFDDGNWWEIVSTYTVGMAKAVAPLEAKVVNADEIKDAVEKRKAILDNNKNVKEADLPKIPKMLDAEGNDLTFQISQELVFASTKTWSYGEVNRQVFNEEVPLAHYYTVARRMDELASSLPLVSK